MVVSLKYAILNGDYDFFFIEALHRDWEFHQSQNVQFSMVIADFFNLKSKRFTVIEDFTSREMRNFSWWLRIFF